MQSKGLSRETEVKSLSRVGLFVTPWTVAYQAPLSVGFSREEYWSGLPFPSPGDLPNPGIKPGSPALQADTLLSEPPGKPSVQAYFFHSFWKICTEMNVTLRDRDPVIENKCLDIKEGRRTWNELGDWD